MGKKKEKLITQSEAARIAGVTRQAIGSILKKQNYNFFVGNQVNINHPDWEIYLNERDSNGGARKKEIDEKIIKPQGRQGKKKPPGKVIDIRSVRSRQKNAFTGGFNPDDYIPHGIQDIKRLTEIARLKLEMMVRTGDLVDRDLLTPILDEIGQTIQAYFVDLPRKVSGKIAKKLDRVGMEKTIEGILMEPVARGIREMKRVTGKASKIKKLRK